MKLRGWWVRMRNARRKRLRERLLAKRIAPGPRRLMGPRPLPMLFAPEDPIAARVDMVRYAAFAEAAAETMETGPAADARARFDEACLFFTQAIEAASRAGLPTEAAELKGRRAALKRVFDAIKKSDLKGPASPKPVSRAPRRPTDP
jgi:acyl-CoA synthetase (NDP forming)